MGKLKCDGTFVSAVCEGQIFFRVSFDGGRRASSGKVGAGWTIEVQSNYSWKFHTGCKTLLAG